MKTIQPILLLALLIWAGCTGSSTDSDEEYDNSADIAFLEQNGRREGVITTESGLQFEVIEEGEGEQPGLDDIVIVEYDAWTVDNRQIATSSDNEPAVIEVSNPTVPRGIREGLQMMRVGGTYQLVLPSDLAFGDNYAFDEFGQIIHRGATIIYRTTLLEIVEF